MRKVTRDSISKVNDEIKKGGPKMEYEVIEEMRKEELRIVNEKYDEMLYLAEEEMLFNTKRVNKKYNKMHRKKSADEDSIVVDLDTDTTEDV